MNSPFKFACGCSGRVLVVRAVPVAVAFPADGSPIVDIFLFKLHHMVSHAHM